MENKSLLYPGLYGVRRRFLCEDGTGEMALECDGEGKDGFE